ncbi:MAG: hypothetical protein O3B09_02185, partial [Proteobacteria bacterium]|nr:hypothetical protein [Pseudomonadota bacterium]
MDVFNIKTLRNIDLTNFDLAGLGCTLTPEQKEEIRKKIISEDFKLILEERDGGKKYEGYEWLYDAVAEQKENHYTYISKEKQLGELEFAGFKHFLYTEKHSPEYSFFLKAVSDFKKNYYGANFDSAAEFKWIYERFITEGSEFHVNFGGNLGSRIKELKDIYDSLSAGAPKEIDISVFDDLRSEVRRNLIKQPLVEFEKEPKKGRVIKKMLDFYLSSYDGGKSDLIVIGDEAKVDNIYQRVAFDIKEGEEPSIDDLVVVRFGRKYSINKGKDKDGHNVFKLVPYDKQKDKTKDLDKLVYRSLEELQKNNTAIYIKVEGDDLAAALHLNPRQVVGFIRDVFNKEMKSCEASNWMDEGQKKNRNSLIKRVTQYVTKEEIARLGLKEIAEILAVLNDIADLDASYLKEGQEGIGRDAENSGFRNILEDLMNEFEKRVRPLIHSDVLKNKDGIIKIIDYIIQILPKTDDQFCAKNLNRIAELTQLQETKTLIGEESYKIFRALPESQLVDKAIEVINKNYQEALIKAGKGAGKELSSFAEIVDKINTNQAVKKAFSKILCHTFHNASARGAFIDALRTQKLQNNDNLFLVLQSKFEGEDTMTNIGLEDIFESIILDSHDPRSIKDSLKSLQSFCEEFLQDHLSSQPDGSKDLMPIKKRIDVLVNDIDKLMTFEVIEDGIGYSLFDKFRQKFKEKLSNREWSKEYLEEESGVKLIHGLVKEIIDNN